jgi:hypothetical protein
VVFVWRESVSYGIEVGGDGLGALAFSHQTMQDGRLDAGGVERRIERGRAKKVS